MGERDGEILLENDGVNHRWNAIASNETNFASTRSIVRGHVLDEPSTRCSIPSIGTPRRRDFSGQKVRSLAELIISKPVRLGCSLIAYLASA